MHESKKGFMHVAAPVHVQPFKLRNYVYRARSMQGKGIRGSEVAQSKMMQPVSHQQATTHPGPKQSAHPIRHAFMSTNNICRCLQLTPMAKLFSRSQSAMCGHSPLDSIHLLVPMSCFWSQFPSKHCTATQRSTTFVSLWLGTALSFPAHMHRHRRARDLSVTVPWVQQPATRA